MNARTSIIHRLLLAPAALALALTSTGCELFGGAVDEVVDEVVDGVDALRDLLLPSGLNTDNLEDCSAEDRERVAAYIECLEDDRDARCAEGGITADECDFDLLLSEPDITGCPTPDDIDPSCGAGLAPDEAVPSVPLDCAAAQRAVLAASGSYVDDPYERLDPTDWSVLDTHRSANTFGIIARYERDDARACYVSFRGSDDPIDVLDNLRAVAHRDCGRLPGRCADGFLSGFEDAVNAGIYESTLDHVADGSCDSLTVVGHSLGGAIADIFAAYLYFEDPITFARGFLSVHTFGQPRVFDGGGSPLADRLDANIAKTRWMRWGDPVPEVPAVDYVHTGTARLIAHAFDWRQQSIRWSFDEMSRDAAGEGFWPPHHMMAAYVDGLERCR